MLRNEAMEDDKRIPSEAAPPSPMRVGQYITGHWASIALTTAVQYSFFTHIDEGTDTCEALAARCGIAPRGAQALLDGLVGLELLSVSDGRYANTEESAFYLVEGRPAYMGEWTKRILGPEGELLAWARLPEIVKEGVADPDSVFDSGTLVLALAQQAWPVALLAAEKLTFALQDAPRVLDLGGGAGAFSAALLGANAKARSTQVDGPAANRVARDYVGRLGAGERFEAVDGDFREMDLGEALYDLVVYSHVAHIYSPEENQRMLRRIRHALKPGGALAIVDFVLHDDRSGPAMPLLFHLEMLLLTRDGASWRESDFRRWLTEADFERIDVVEPTSGAATLIIAR